MRQSPSQLRGEVPHPQGSWFLAETLWAKDCSAQAPSLVNNKQHVMEGKSSAWSRLTLSSSRARQQGPLRDTPGQHGLHRGLVKLCTSMPQQCQCSHITTAFMFFPLKWTKLFSEFPTEGKFSSWLHSTRMGTVLPEELFVQVEQEQQQSINPFPAWTRAMEAEELQMPSLWVHSWEPPRLSSHLLLLLPPLPLHGTLVRTPDL